MNPLELLNQWQRDNRVVSITLHEGLLSALVFVKGEPYSVRADCFTTLIEKIDNTMHDCRVSVIMS
jgi:hypothetical protein